MLQARSVVLVGASERPGSLGARMAAEVARSPSRPRVHLVNPRYGPPYLPRIADVPERPDLVLLAVPDDALADQLAAAADVGARSAVVFGSASLPCLRDKLAGIAAEAGMALCGAGCMGFVNLAHGLRAIGYVEQDPLPAGPVALVTHSGSVFSTLLRARRGFGFTLAVSSGQELVTTAADYARYALAMPRTRVLALVLETIRGDLRGVLADAAAQDVPVVLLTAGSSGAGRALVAAHSGALAAGDGAWQALAAAYGVHRVGDLAELADTLELFASPRRAFANGIATVHDSGLERAHAADIAAEAGLPFAAIGRPAKDRLAAVLDPGLEPANPLDVWGTGRDTQALFTECLSALAADPAVGAVALAVDLVPEFDGDASYPNAITTVAAATGKPVVLLAGLSAAIDQAAAATLRADGVPVLEGTRTGLLALRHLLHHGTAPRAPASAPVDHARRERWIDGGDAFALLRDYGIPTVRALTATTRDEALEAASGIGYPVVLKTAEPGIAHKSEVGGVVLGLRDAAELTAAYDDLAARLGARTLVCETAPPGTELLLGLARDQALGPLIVLGCGGIYTEIFSERTVLLPPVTREAAMAAIRGLRVAPVLNGARGQPVADLDAIAGAVSAMSALAAELGDVLDALDVNPLICGPSGVLAVDALAVPRWNGHGRST
ncbi:MAG TPA: acetate--CoA ligase family protein [Streptosporangiaceae bacterium]